MVQSVWREKLLTLADDAVRHSKRTVARLETIHAAYEKYLDDKELMGLINVLNDQFRDKDKDYADEFID